jgi:hypothetical protein
MYEFTGYAVVCIEKFSEYAVKCDFLSVGSKSVPVSCRCVLAAVSFGYLDVTQPFALSM